LNTCLSARAVIDRSASPSSSPGPPRPSDAGEWFSSQQCFVVMDSASDYRKQADHARQLAEATWQHNLGEMLCRLAQDFDEIAEDIEAGATGVRHSELLR
jgi:hypothetical protein